MTAARRPLPLVLLGVGVVLSIATTPEGEPESSFSSSMDSVGELAPDAPLVLSFHVEVACAGASRGEPTLPREVSFGMEARANVLGGLADTASRTHLVAEMTVDGVAVSSDEAYVYDEQWMGVGTDADALLDGCSPAAPCGKDVTFTFTANADVRLEWEVWSQATWFDAQSSACSVLSWPVD